MPFIFTGEILKWGQFSNLLIVKSNFFFKEHGEIRLYTKHTMDAITILYTKMWAMNKNLFGLKNYKN